MWLQMKEYRRRDWLNVTDAAGVIYEQDNFLHNQQTVSTH